MEVLTSVSDK